MTDISKEHLPTPAKSQELQQALPSLTVPDSSFRRVIHLVSDAGPLIQTLESGIPAPGAVLEGLLQIPLARWSLSYSSEDARALTNIKASPSSSGSQPFVVNLSRFQDFWGDAGRIESPQAMYEGSISYSLGGSEHHVNLSRFPSMLEDVFDALESRLQEPTVRDSRRASIEKPAATHAADREWVNIRLKLHGDDGRSYLPPNCRTFLNSLATEEVARWKTADAGDSYRYHGINHAWLYSFDNGESLALARLKVSFVDQYGNDLGDVATTLIVGSRGMPRHRFHLFLNHEFNPSEFHNTVWRLTTLRKSEQ